MICVSETLPRDPHQRLADAFEPAAETLAPVTGDQHQLLRRITEWKPGGQIGSEPPVTLDAVAHRQQRIDHSVCRSRR